jgi:putative membrane protein
MDNISQPLGFKNDKLIFRIILVVSIAVFALVVILNRKLLGQPENIPSFIYSLPKLNALLNGTCSVLLIFSLIAIKKKKITVHKKINLTAFALSTLFLLSYVTAHYFIPDTFFGDANHDGILDANEKAEVSGIKPFYLVILLSHIFLAAIVLPMVLLSFYFGLKNDVAKHRKIARITYPIWLYVTITGVVVYFMISPYYAY